MTDNGKYFDNPALKEMCQELGIRKLFSTPGHPQANGQVEAANKMIKDNLKKKLERLKGAWADELPMVLWAHCITPKGATGETPFSFVFGIEAVIPAEVKLPSYRVENFTEQENDIAVLENLDFLEKKMRPGINSISSPKTTGHEILQREGPTTLFPTRRLGAKENVSEYPRSLTLRDETSY